MFRLVRSRPVKPDPVKAWSSLFIGQPPEWVWCSQCQRAARLREARFEAGVWRCYYADCRGVLTDLWAWQAVRATCPAWPPVPTMHMNYALFAAA
jgi:hypothetical protein